jgi:hypothetical protein
MSRLFLREFLNVPLDVRVAFRGEYPLHHFIGSKLVSFLF